MLRRYDTQASAGLACVAFGVAAIAAWVAWLNLMALIDHHLPFTPNQSMAGLGSIRQPSFRVLFYYTSIHFALLSAAKEYYFFGLILGKPRGL